MWVTPDISEQLQPYLMHHEWILLAHHRLQFNNSSIEAVNPRTGNLSTTAPSVIILAYNLCFALALNKTKDFKISSIACFLSPSAIIVFYSMDLTSFPLSFQFFYSRSLWQNARESIPTVFGRSQLEGRVWFTIQHFLPICAGITLPTSSEWV